MKTNNKSNKFVEDILKQDEFDPADLMNAERKHPILHRLKLAWQQHKFDWELKCVTLKEKASEPKEKAIYYEDLLQQKEFSLDDWRKAKRKRPILTWARSSYMIIQDTVQEVKYFFRRLRLRLIK